MHTHVIEQTPGGRPEPDGLCAGPCRPWRPWRVRRTCAKKVPKFPQFPGLQAHGGEESPCFSAGNGSHVYPKDLEKLSFTRISEGLCFFMFFLYFLRFALYIGL